MAAELTHQFEVLAKFVLEKLETDVISVNKDRGAAETVAIEPDPWGVVKTNKGMAKSGTPQSQPNQNKEVVKSGTPQSQPNQNKGSNLDAGKGASHDTIKAQRPKTTVEVRKSTARREEVTKVQQKTTPGSSKVIQNVVKSITKDIMSDLAKSRDEKGQNSAKDNCGVLAAQEQVIDKFCDTVANFEAPKDGNENVVSADISMRPANEKVWEKESVDHVPEEQSGLVEVAPIVIVPIDVEDMGKETDNTPLSNPVTEPEKDVTNNSQPKERENIFWNILSAHTGTDDVENTADTSIPQETSTVSQDAQSNKPLDADAENIPSSSAATIPSSVPNTVSGSIDLTTSHDNPSVVEPAMIVPIPDTPNGRETWASNTDNVTISIVTKEDGSTELVLQTVKENAKEEATESLPWIPAIEPTDLTSAPVEERFRAMKTKVDEILSEREQMKLNTKETTDVIKNIRAKLSKSDLDEVKTLTDEAVKEKPADVKTALGPWKITQRLKVICRFVLSKFKVANEEIDAASGGNNVETENISVANVTSSVADHNDAINRTTNLPSSTEISNPSEPSPQGETSTSSELCQISNTGSILQSTRQGSASSEHAHQNISAAEETRSSAQSSTAQAGTSTELHPQQMKDAIETDPVAQSVPKTSNTDATPKPGESQIVPANTPSESHLTTEPVTPTSTVTENKQAADSSSDSVSTGSIPQSPSKSVNEKKIEYPVIVHKMTASKEVSISNEITLPELPLPWIREIEPVDLSRATVKERHTAMKQNITDLLGRRQNFQLSDPDASRIIQSIIKRLDKRDTERLDAVRNKVIKYKGNDPAARPFILTQQLQMICFYALQRVEKQPESQKRTVTKWLKTKAQEYYSELTSFSISYAKIKEKYEALTLHLTDGEKKIVNSMVAEECASMKKLFVWDSQVSFLSSVIGLELTCLYLERLASESLEPLLCTVTKKIAEILLDKKKVANMDPFDSEDAVRVIKKALKSNSNTPRTETEVKELETLEQPESSKVASKTLPKAAIKLKLSASKKGTSQQQK